MDKSNVVYGLHFALDEFRVRDQGEEIHHVGILNRDGGSGRHPVRLRGALLGQSVLGSYCPAEH